MRRRHLTLGAVAIMLSLGLAGTTSNAATEDSIPPAAVIGPVMMAVTQSTPVIPDLLGVFIADALAQVGTVDQVSALIIDDASGDVLFSQQANRAMIPASTLKLLTSVGVLQELGLEKRFTTRVVQAGQTLTLVGGGDPTLVSAIPANWRGKPPGVEQPPSLDHIADLVAAKLAGTNGPFIINVDSSFFASAPQEETWPASYVGDGYVAPVTGLTVDFGVDENNHAYKNPALFAGEYLATALTARGLPSSVGIDASAGTKATEIASVQSAQLVDIVERMVTTSNNTMAEYLSHHVGKKNGDDSFAGSANVIQQRVINTGVDATGLELHDASGLSASNKVTAKTIVDVIRYAHQQNSVVWPLLSGLPIAGVSGTLEERFAAADSGRGYVRAKTGTLSGVVSLAGSVTTASGNVLDYAVIANGISSTLDTQKNVDTLIKRLSECGCS